LAQTDEIDGVQSSSSNRSGRLLKLALKPGADPAKVVQEVERVLIAQLEDRVPVPLAGEVAVAAAEGQEWWDHSQVAEVVAAAEIPPPVRQPAMALLLLLLWWLIVALGLCWWQRRRMLAAARRKALLA
jgi:hypothetical protein